MNATLPPPTITTGCQQILDALTLWLGTQGLSHTLENAVFAEDRDIDYAHRMVTAAHVQAPPQFELCLTRLLAGGPTGFTPTSFRSRTDAFWSQCWQVRLSALPVPRSTSAMNGAVL